MRSGSTESDENSNMEIHDCGRQDRKGCIHTMHDMRHEDTSHSIVIRDSILHIAFNLLLEVAHASPSYDEYPLASAMGNHSTRRTGPRETSPPFIPSFHVSRKCYRKRVLMFEIQRTSRVTDGQPLSGIVVWRILSNFEPHACFS